MSESNLRQIGQLMTDVVLPGASGPKLANRLATSRSGMKVLFVSGYTADALAHGDLHRTDFAFLSKPFSLNTLARKIRTSWTQSASAQETGNWLRTALPPSITYALEASATGIYS